MVANIVVRQVPNIVVNVRLASIGNNLSMDNRYNAKGIIVVQLNKVINVKVDYLVNHIDKKVNIKVCFLETKEKVYHIGLGVFVCSVYPKELLGSN